jgi:hypothetical protein
VDTPDKFYPRNVFLVIEFIKVFEKESIVLASKIDYSKSSFSFGLTTLLPGH